MTFGAYRTKAAATRGHPRAAAVILEDHLVVAWPVDTGGENEYMPRSAEIRSVMAIPVKNVVPRV
jgi:hypothetical protein